MLEYIINFALARRSLVMALALMLMGLGAWKFLITYKAPLAHLASQ
ncbi:MAG: hypothetical protein H8E21_11190 [Gammaproteobacteria bacterium]|nr:hypothetical protein [Gammaproteobacteria bacterium]